MAIFAKIKSNKEFINFKNSNKKIVAKNLVVVRLNREIDDETGLAFIVTKKIGNAVKRNKTKRKLRSACIEVKKKGHFASSCNYLIIARHSVLEANFVEIIDDLTYCLNKLDAK